MAIDCVGGLNWSVMCVFGNYLPKHMFGGQEQVFLGIKTKSLI